MGSGIAEENLQGHLNMNGKPSRGKSYAILGVGVILGIVGAHVYYVMSAKAAIAELMAPGRVIKINYGNLPHIQTLVYGLIGGLIVGALGAVISNRRRPTQADQG